MAGVITAANLAAAKNNVNLPGAFGQQTATKVTAGPIILSGDPGPGKTPTPAPTPTPTGIVASFGPTAAQLAAAQAATDYQNLKNTAYGSITDATNAGAGAYNEGLQEYLAQEKQQQNTINGQSVQNELSRQQGHQGVLDMIGNGLESSGQILASHNAGSSSAGEAFARAYGTLGRQQESKVGNQFAQGQAGIQTTQDNLTAANTEEIRKSGYDKSTTINGIVAAATDKLNQLNQAAAYASLPDRIQIDQEKATIQAQAMAALSQYDQVLTQGIAANAPESPDAVRAQASKLLTSGVAPQNQFNYTTVAPPSVQGTGPSPSSLPIFTAPTAKKDTTV